MEMHQLRYFVAVAHTGNFSRAAERCFVSQPSLSQQVQKLEKSLGQRLFDRLGRRAVLTDAGRLLLDRATAILAAVDDAEQRLKDFDQLEGGCLAVGAIPTVAPYLFPPTLKRFLPLCPHIDLTVHEDLTRHLLESVAGGELDLALVALPVADDRLAVEALHTEPLLLALPPRHPLLKHKAITVEALQAERLIVLDEMHCLGEQVLSFCNEKGCHRIACRSTQLSTVQHLIAMGQGVSLLPAMAIRQERNPRLAYRALPAPQPTRTLVAVWHKHRYHSAAAERFLAELKAVLGGLGG
jgi:LysR family hydrogen peroxide-inducible transcriptional activator